MVNIFNLIIKPLINGLMKLAGLTPQLLELEPGTVMHIWVPKQAILKQNSNAKTRYVPPTKRAVLLVHPFETNGAFTWFFQALALSKDYAVYVPDLLFFGDSYTDKPDRSPSFQAEFLAKGMRVLEVEKFVLVGSSYGGMVGFKMAKLYPEMVESMVVSGSVTHLTESISESAYKRLCISKWADLLLPESVDGVKRLMSIAHHEAPRIPDFMFRHVLEVMFSNRKERAELLDALVVRDKDVTHHSYSQTIHLLWGANDKIFSLEIAQKIKERLGEKATLQYIEKGGHIVYQERPFVYNRLLKQILENGTMTSQ